MRPIKEYFGPHLSPRFRPPIVTGYTHTDKLFVLTPHLIEPTDYDDWYEIAGKPAVTRYMSWPERTHAQTNAHLLRRALRHASLKRPNDFLAMAVRNEDNRLIGDVSCHLREIGTDGMLSVEAGWVFNPLYQGQGYASAAVIEFLNMLRDQINVRHVYATIDPENTASHELAARLGFSEPWLTEIGEVQTEKFLPSGEDSARL